MAKWQIYKCQYEQLTTIPWVMPEEFVEFCCFSEASFSRRVAGARTPSPAWAGAGLCSAQLAGATPVAQIPAGSWHRLFAELGICSNVSTSSLGLVWHPES